jgi:RNA polymerase sigma-70 factor (ECF subfamily)
LVAVLCARPGTEVSLEAVNGRAGLAVRRNGRAVAVLGIHAFDEFTVLWIVLNPVKLHAWHHS